MNLKTLLTWAACYVAILAASAAETQPAAVQPAPTSYQIRNKQFSDLLRPEDANSKDGTPIVLYPGQPWKCMTWQCLPAAESTVRLRNHFTSKTLAPTGKTDGNTVAVLQSPLGPDAKGDPVWQLIALPDGMHRIVDPKTGKSLTAVKTSGDVRIVIAPWKDQEGQKWELIKTDPAKLTM